mgnify:CR=1 FL=1
MKKIYIVLSYTGTILSRIVKLYTRKEYSHVSIALDKSLDHMYSFGRLNPYNPFIGGFIQESPNYGTFKRFKNTKTKIYSLEVSDEDYEIIKNTIEDVSKNRHDYRFNIMGLITVMGHYHLKRENCFYCAEFVKYVLSASSLDLNLPEIIKPEDFQKMDGLHVIYTGKLSEYDTL